MLQGGPLPCFLDEDQLQRLFGNDLNVSNQAENQFREGVTAFGLVEVSKYSVSV